MARSLVRCFGTMPLYLSCRITAGIILAMAIPISLLPGQAPPAQPDGGPPPRFSSTSTGQPGVPPSGVSDIRVDVDVVNVLSTVRDWRGGYVTDLEKSDFKILEDGKPQEIRYFTREVNTPFTVALLLDVSGSVSRILEKERSAASRFFTEVLEPQDRALLVTFSHIVAISQDLTSSTERLRAALRSVHPFDINLPPESGAHGGTLLYEAVKTVCDQKLAGLPGRKAMVIVSDGFDNGSRVTAQEAIRAVQEADTVIYTIHYAGDAGEPPEGELALNDLAEPTGGRSFNVRYLVPLESIFDTIRQELRSQYAIGYVSTNRARDGGYRRLTVKTNHKGLKVQARNGYYAPR
jgi:VWFA-related protein